MCVIRACARGSSFGTPMGAQKSYRFECLLLKRKKCIFFFVVFVFVLSCLFGFLNGKNEDKLLWNFWRRNINNIPKSDASMGDMKGIRLFGFC